MNMDGIPTHLLVDGAKYACNAKAVPFMVRQKGDASRGTMLVALLDLRGNAKVYRQQRNDEFELCWFNDGLIAETTAEAAIQSALKGDPDQWVIEIEDPSMNFPFEGTQA